MEAGEVGPLLDKYDFALVEQKSPADLENAYFLGPDCHLLGKVNGTQSIAFAEKK